jgi:hypothetical protein
MPTILETVNLTVAANPPLSMTTIPAIRTVPSSGNSGIVSHATSALASQMAVLVANSSHPDVSQIQTDGAAVVIRPDQTGLLLVGKLALTSSQLEKAGIIKPGGSVFVNAKITEAISLLPAALLASDSTVCAQPFYSQNDIDIARQYVRTTMLSPEKMLPNFLFVTGSLDSLIKSEEQQLSIFNINMDQITRSLIRSGAITGKESNSTLLSVMFAAMASHLNMDDGITYTVSGMMRLASKHTSIDLPHGDINIFGNVDELMSMGHSAGKLAVASSKLGTTISHLTGLGFVGDPETIMSSAVMTNYPKLPAGVSVDLSSSINSSPHKDLPWTMTTRN